MIVLTYQYPNRPMITIIIDKPLIHWMKDNPKCVIVNTEKITLETEDDIEAYDFLK